MMRHLVRSLGRNAFLICFSISAIYTLYICLLVYLTSPLDSFFFTYFSLLVYFLIFFFENRPAPFPTWCHKKRPNLGLSCFSLFWVIVFCVPDAWLFCIVINLVICIRLGLLYIFGSQPSEVIMSDADCTPGREPRSIAASCGYFCWVRFRFLSTNQEIGWEEHLPNDLFCVEWDVKS